MFDIDQSRRILEAGKNAGMRINFHADELNPLKGAEVYKSHKSTDCFSITG